MGGGGHFDPDARDGVTEPFIHLRDQLATRGYDLRTADDAGVSEVAQVWFWDVPSSLLLRRSPWRRLKSRLTSAHRDLLAECKSAGLMGRVFLIIGEPPVVRPENWDPRFHALFVRCLTWSDDLVDNGRYFKFRFPLPSQYPRPTPAPFGSQKLLVNISANKRSSHSLELYSARRRTIRYFETQCPAQFELYGPGWDRVQPAEKPYDSYRGLTDHKWRIYGQFRFGLCYENMRDMRGYVTEKIFDCIRSGAVPVYWGAPNVGDYVDQEAFVDRTIFSSDAELARFLGGVGETEHGRYIEAGRDYLQTSRFKAFLPAAFADSIIEAFQLA
jgi:hypothetical protein